MSAGTVRCRCVFPDKCFCDGEQRAARREVEKQLARDRKSHGFSVLSAAGERVDPGVVRMLGLPESA